MISTGKPRWFKTDNGWYLNPQGLPIGTLVRRKATKPSTGKINQKTIIMLVRATKMTWSSQSSHKGVITRATIDDKGRPIALVQWLRYLPKDALYTFHEERLYSEQEWMEFLMSLRRKVYREKPQWAR